MPDIHHVRSELGLALIGIKTSILSLNTNLGSGLGRNTPGRVEKREREKLSYPRFGVLDLAVFPIYHLSRPGFGGTNSKNSKFKSLYRTLNAKECDSEGFLVSKRN